MKTIFVSIAAYEDPQLKETILSALSQADEPDRIFFGVALQYNKEPDLSEFNNIRLLKYDPETRPGIVKIRYEISRLLFEGQDFYLQIDSHYLFANGWDTKLISAYDNLASEYASPKVMILPLEVYGDEVMSSRFTLNMEDIGIGTNIVHPHPDNSRIPYSGLEYQEICYARVGQIFFPGAYIADVGLDKYSQTSLEIAYFSYRTLMSGYRVFQLNDRILWENSQKYYEAVWDGDSPADSLKKPNRFGSSMAKESPHTWYELSLALIYNDFSKYAIANASISPGDFWKMQGQEYEYLAAKEYFDKIIHNSYQ